MIERAVESKHILQYLRENIIPVREVPCVRPPEYLATSLTTLATNLCVVGYPAVPDQQDVSAVLRQHHQAPIIDSKGGVDL